MVRTSHRIIEYKLTLSALIDSEQMLLSIEAQLDNVLHALCALQLMKAFVTELSMCAQLCFNAQQHFFCISPELRRPWFESRQDLNFFLSLCKHSHNNNSHFSSLTATGIQMVFFSEGRILGLVMTPLTMPLYTSPKAPSPRHSSIMTSLGATSHSSTASSEWFSFVGIFLGPTVNIESSYGSCIYVQL